MTVHPDAKAVPAAKNHRPAGIAIVGNMNVGKTALFSRMSDGHISSVNIPGNTVSVVAGHIKGTNRDIYDTPGIFSIFSTNEDERASRDIILPHITDNGVEGVIVVADAKNLRRSISIALQYAEYGLPMLIDINMIDEAVSRGIEIDVKALSEVLGIDVCTTVARDGMGVSKVISSTADMRIPHRQITYPDRIEQFLQMVSKLLGSTQVSTRAIGLLLLADDDAVKVYVESEFGSGMAVQLNDLAEEFFGWGLLGTCIWTCEGLR
jgi:ferrous iron transport protein B